VTVAADWEVVDLAEVWQDWEVGVVERGAAVADWLPKSAHRTCHALGGAHDL